MNWEIVEDRPYHIQVYIDAFGDIPKNHHIHHIDNNHFNDDPQNLIAVSKTMHKNIHSNYAFYLSIARNGLVNKKLLQDLLAYYEYKGYHARKSFQVVFVEFLLTFTKYELFIKGD